MKTFLLNLLINVSFAAGVLVSNIQSALPKATKARRRWGQPWWARKKRPKDPVTGEEIPPKPKPGKELEEAFGAACKSFSVPQRADAHPPKPGYKPSAYWNSNSTNPVCDARLCFFGISIVAECKECSENNYGFRRMSERERNNLEAHELGGGLSVVFILHRAPDGVRLYALSWRHWKELEARGREIGRTTFPLTRQGRPPCLRELNLNSQDPLKLCPDSLFVFLTQTVSQYLSWNLKKLTETYPHV